jgi:hypothetical protein
LLKVGAGDPGRPSSICGSVIVPLAFALHSD